MKARNQFYKNFIKFFKNNQFTQVIYINKKNYYYFYCNVDHKDKAWKIMLNQKKQRKKRKPKKVYDKSYMN